MLSGTDNKSTLPDLTSLTLPLPLPEKEQFHNQLRESMPISLSLSLFPPKNLRKIGKSRAF